MKFIALICVTCSIFWKNAVGHYFSKRNVPKDNMNGEYLISNPNHATGKSYSTLYSSRPDIEYFDVYTPPISTR